MLDKKLIIVNLAVICIVAAMFLANTMGEDGSIVALFRDSSSVTNAGTVDVVLERSSTTGMTVLGIDESIDVGRGEDVKAEQV